jgi:hypothetical protein
MDFMAFRPRSASRADTVSSSYSQEFENSFSKATSLSSSRSWTANVIFTSCTLLSLGVKIWSLIVYFSRMRIQVMLLGPSSSSSTSSHHHHSLITTNNDNPTISATTVTTDTNNLLTLFDSSSSPQQNSDDSSHIVTTLLNTFLIDFSFPEMVRDFWHARAYFVAIVIVFGSAIVPLTRHAFLLWAWFMPIHSRSIWSTIRTRGLIFFDHVGRSSLVDLFLLGYVVCIFYTQVNQYIVTNLVGVRIQINAEPVRGIFMGITTMISGTFLNHYLILVDEERLMGRAERRVTVGAGPPVASLMQRLWASSETGCFKLWSTTVLGCLVLVCGILMFILFFGDPLVAFHMEGLAGVVANEEWRDFYLLTAPLDTPSRTTNTHGGQLLSIMYIGVIVVVPIALLLATAVLWVIPLDLRQQRTALSLYPFWFSWCSVDVLFITTLAAYLEMHMIAEFTFDNKFKLLCATVKETLGMSCSSLGRRLESGLPVLGVVSLLFALLHLVFAKIAARLLESEPAASIIWPIDSPFAEHYMSSASTSPRLALESPIVIGRTIYGNTSNSNNIVFNYGNNGGGGGPVVSSTLVSGNNNNNSFSIPAPPLTTGSSNIQNQNYTRVKVLSNNKDSTSSNTSVLSNENVHSRRVI